MNFIYLTTNLINGKQYVGSHRGAIDDLYLGSGKILKSAIKKYGIQNFKREILEECLESQNLILEEKYIKKYKTLQPNGYNISNTGGYQIFDNNLRRKLSISKKGIRPSKEAIEKRRQSMLGKNKGPKTEKTKQKIRESKIGCIPWNKGIKWSEEIKEKMSKSHQGQKKSEETKKKMSEFQKNRIRSDKEKINISESKKGSKNPMYGKTAWNKGLKIKK